MGKLVDLNSDMGESFGVYKLGLDEEILRYVSSANIACGWHAGDPIVMRKTVETALGQGVGIGAHPGFPDLLGFGRRNMVISREEARDYIIYQIGALDAFIRAQGGKMQHVKPHGNLYNLAMKDKVLAEGIVQGIWEVNRELIVLGLPGSELLRAAEGRGLKIAREVFADRAYNVDGILVPRNLPGSMINDRETAVKRALRMVTEGRVTAINGEDIEIQADSICVHGDNPEAVEFVKNIRDTLVAAGIEIKALGEVVKAGSDF